MSALRRRDYLYEGRDVQFFKRILSGMMKALFASDKKGDAKEAKVQLGALVRTAGNLATAMGDKDVAAKLENLGNELLRRAQQA